MHVGLINFNTRGATQEGVPPVPPIGLEYLADGLEADGVDVSLLDLCFAPRDLWKDMIADLFSKEDPHKPLSDQEVVKILCDKGIQIARRTVAKYRSELNILPSNLRKVY